MKKKTKEQFIKESIEIHGKHKYDYSKVEYVNGSTNVIIICPDHGEFEVTPNKHLIRKQGCPKCVEKNKGYYIKKFNEIHNNKYDYSKSIIKNSKDKFEIVCPKHGSFLKNIQNHLNNKQGCPECSKIEYNNKNKTPIKEFIKRAKYKHGDKYDYSLVNYKTLSDNIKIICPIHGVFEKIAYEHICIDKFRKENSGGCPECLKDNWINSTEKFITKSKEIHGDKYDYSKSIYANPSTKIIITCPNHGDFMISPNNHINGGGCKQCAIDNKKLSFEDFIIKCNKIHDNKYNYSKSEKDYTGRNRNKVIIICPKHGEFSQSTDDHCNGCGCPKCGARKSQYEDWVENYLIKNNIKYIKNDRDVLNPNEIDFILPDYKIGIEVNGLRFHSENYGKKNKKYHLNKTITAKDNNYFLIHLFSSDLIYKNTKIKSKLNSLLHINKYPIYARKCEIRNIDYKTSSKFLEKYHIQGKDNGSIRLGLFYKNKLVSVMTFCKRRICMGKKSSEVGEYELSRFCGNNTFYVVGGASKLLKYFEKNYNPTKIVTYADKRFSEGNLYFNLGFVNSHDSDPSYWYFPINNDMAHPYHRFNFRKNVLKDKLENFDPEKSEWENMKQNGWDRIWDCGTMVFKKIIDN